MRPEWTEKLGVVMTSGNNDPEEWREIIGNKRHKDEMAKKFKDNDSPLKIAIVVDMWLTGHGWQCHAIWSNAGYWEKCCD